MLYIDSIIFACLWTVCCNRFCNMITLHSLLCSKLIIVSLENSFIFFSVRITRVSFTKGECLHLCDSTCVKSSPSPFAKRYLYTAKKTFYCTVKVYCKDKQELFKVLIQLQLDFICSSFVGSNTSWPRTDFPVPPKSLYILNKMTTLCLNNYGRMLKSKQHT